LGPFANEVEELQRLFSKVNAPNEIGIKMIEQLYPLYRNVDEHCSNTSKFIKDMMDLIQNTTEVIYPCLKEL
jgi:hypothetical protein